MVHAMNRGEQFFFHLGHFCWPQPFRDGGDVRNPELLSFLNLTFFAQGIKTRGEKIRDFASYLRLGLNLVGLFLAKCFQNGGSLDVLDTKGEGKKQQTEKAEDQSPAKSGLEFRTHQMAVMSRDTRPLISFVPSRMNAKRKANPIAYIAQYVSRMRTRSIKFFTRRNLEHLSTEKQVNILVAA